jgi:hypothetical protein
MLFTLGCASTLKLAVGLTRVRRGNIEIVEQKIYACN